MPYILAILAHAQDEFNFQVITMFAEVSVEKPLGPRTAAASFGAGPAFSDILSE